MHLILMGAPGSGKGTYAAVLKKYYRVPHISTGEIFRDALAEGEKQIRCVEVTYGGEIKTPDVSIKVAPDRTDLIQTKVIDGVKYILICAEENIEVNGVSIHVEDKDACPL